MKMFNLERFLLVFSSHPTVGDPKHRQLDRASSSPDLALEDSHTPDEVEWAKIRFHNTIRLWMASVCYLGCWALWIGRALHGIGEITIVFFAYGAVQLMLTWYGKATRHVRVLNYVLCGIDLLAMTLGIHFSGGLRSPLYFVFFIPLIVHAFHHDGPLIRFNGFVGTALYAVVIVCSVSAWTPENVVEFGTRLFFMLVTVGLENWSVKMLMDKDAIDARRQLHMKLVLFAAQRINRIALFSDLVPGAEEVLRRMNRDLAKHLQADCQLFLIQESGHLLVSVTDPLRLRPEVRQELPMNACPAMVSNQILLMHDPEKDPCCPVQTFPFLSHACVPVSGVGNECLGVLHVGSLRPAAFDSEDLQLFQFVARSLALCLQRLRHHGELRRQVEMEGCALSMTMKSLHSLESTNTAFLDGLLTVSRADQASLLLWDPPSGLLRARSSVGPFSSRLRDVEMRMGEGVPGRALETGKPYWTVNPSEVPPYGELPAKAVAVLPICGLKGEPFGVVVLLRFERKLGFSELDINLGMTLSVRAQLALEQARLLEPRREPTTRDTPPSTLHQAA